ncbi:MAG: hypothetical protein KGI50_03880 [Patescibacteria group bacterium]|nr:hypothetical protein [Patescibacteria group bacterium]MDE2438427.1 hypothetical protein [Patescibacteria group bacterium]
MHHDIPHAKELKKLLDIVLGAYQDESDTILHEIDTLLTTYEAQQNDNNSSPSL